MRLYPIHIIVKDVSLFFLFLVFSGSIGPATPETLLVNVSFSLRMMAGIILLNLILQTMLFFLRRYLRFRKMYKQFLFGLTLHIPTMVLWATNEVNENKIMESITALVLSGLISGLLYVVLNGDILKRAKNIVRLHHDVQRT